MTVPPLRLKQLLALLVAALLPAAALLGWQAWSAIRADRERIDDALERSAVAFARSVDAELASSIDALTVLSQSEIFQQGRIAAMGRLLHGRPRRDWDSVFLLDANGAVVLDTAVHGPSIPAEAMRELHARALRSGAAVVSGATAAPGIAIAMPIKQAGRVRYVLGVRTSDSVWPRLAAGAPVAADGIARLEDSQGRLIAQSPEAPRSGETYEAQAPVVSAGWRALVFVPAAPVEARHRTTILTALATIGASIALGLLLAMLVARRVARPAGDRTGLVDELGKRGSDP